MRYSDSSFVKPNGLLRGRFYKNSSRHESNGLAEPQQCNGKKCCGNSHDREHLWPDDFNITAAIKYLPEKQIAAPRSPRDRAGKELHRQVQSHSPRFFVVSGARKT